MAEFMMNYADTSSELYTLTSWSSIFFDFNNDGLQDLYVANGAVITDLTPEATNQPNYLLANNGDHTFTQVPCWGMPDIRGSSRGAAVGDLDRDGDLDIVWVDNGDNGEAGVFVARNDATDWNWSIIELQGRGANREGIGAKITLYANGVGAQHRWIDGGQSFLSVSERMAHFGLQAAEVIDAIEITWPSGVVQDVDPLPPVNQRYFVMEP